MEHYTEVERLLKSTECLLSSFPVAAKKRHLLQAFHLRHTSSLLKKRECIGKRVKDEASTTVMGGGDEAGAWRRLGDKTKSEWRYRRRGQGWKRTGKGESTEEEREMGEDKEWRKKT